MKHLTWLPVAWSVLIAVAASCSVTHRSGDFACTTTADCSPDRVCSDGYCVVPGGPNPTVDAPKDPNPKDGPDKPPKDGPVEPVCPPGCSACDPNTMVCAIVCGAPGAANCSQPITCPEGWNCQITCGRNSDCRSGIDCTGGASCQVQCSGAGSCRNVECGSGPCEVTCSGFNSCTQNIQCLDSCRCDVHCSGPGQETCGGSQQTAAMCGSIACDSALDGGCTSQPANLCASTCP